MESPEDLEKALARLVPSAISEKGQRSMEDLIDSLAAGETVATPLPVKKSSHWSWLGGIGAAAAAVVVALSLPLGDAPTVVEKSATPEDPTAKSGVVLIGQSEVVEDAVPEDWMAETDGVPQRMEAKGMIPKGEICRIWQSPEITNGPFTARKNLPVDLIQEMRAVVKATPEKAPDVYKEMTGGDVSTDKGYVEVDHQRYQWIVDMREWLKKQRRAG